MRAMDESLGAQHTSSATAEPAARDLRLAYALVFVTPAFWSVNYLVARWAPGVIAPHALALGRWSVAALVLQERADRQAHAHPR